MIADKELLELAARAAGITGIVVVEEHGVYWNEFPDHPGATYNIRWNPLTDDGDALRLAVKLSLTVCCDMRDGNACATGIERKVEVFDTDPYAATRRAIVRAAAEIGKSL